MRGSTCNLIKLAWPLALAQTSYVLYSLGDGYFLAQHSSSAMIASLPASMIIATLTTLFAGTIGYTTAFISQACGGENQREAVRFFIHGLWLTICSAPLLLAMIPVAHLLIDLCGHTPSVASAEKSYLMICAPGGLLTELNVALGSYFTGQGRTRYAATCCIAGHLVNLVADRILILGLGGIPALGIVGAGLATILGAAINTIMLSVAIFRDPAFRRHADRELFRPQLSRMIRILRYSLPAGATATFSAMTFMVFSLVLTDYDEMSTTAANAVFRINNVFYMILCATSDATLILTGRHHGAGDDNAVRQACRSGLVIMFIALTLCYGVIITYSGPILDCFRGTDSTYPITEYHQLGLLLICIMLFREICEGMIYIFSGALRGVGDTKFVMLVQCGCDLLCWTPCVLYIGEYGLPLLSLWISMPANMAIIALALGFRWRSRRWQIHRLTESSGIAGVSELAH